MHTSLKRMWALLGVVAAIGAVAATSAIASHKAGPTIVIWTDANRAASVSKVANSWAASNGATIQVVTKDFGSIETALGTVAAADAPDVVVAAHDWTGQLAANGLVEPLYPSKAVAAQFPKYTLDAFSYGTAVKKLYGIPVQIENIGLLVNTKLAKVPTTFAQLETEALAAKKKAHLSFGICVQQGSGGDAYHMYPFFSGLGGYVFGTNKAGNLNPKDVGVANPTFIKNSKLIDKWNKEGLINSKTDYSVCDTAFTKGQDPVLDHRPVGRRPTSRRPACRSRSSRCPRSSKAVGAVPRRQRHDGHEVRDHAQRRRGGEGSRRELLHDAFGPDAARCCRRPRTGEPQGEGDRPDPGAVPHGQQGRRPDAEHSSDERRLERSRPGVGPLDEGRRRNAGRALLQGRGPCDLVQDRLAERPTHGAGACGRPLRRSPTSGP